MYSSSKFTSYLPRNLFQIVLFQTSGSKGITPSKKAFSAISKWCDVCHIYIYIFFRNMYWMCRWLMYILKAPNKSNGCGFSLLTRSAAGKTENQSCSDANILSLYRYIKYHLITCSISIYCTSPCLPFATLSPLPLLLLLLLFDLLIESWLLHRWADGSGWLIHTLLSTHPALWSNRAVPQIYLMIFDVWSVSLLQKEPVRFNTLSLWGGYYAKQDLLFFGLIAF